MACYTMITPLIDNALNRRARRKLGFAEEGTLTRAQQTLVRVEAGVMKTIAETRRLYPAAVIKRNGNKLTVGIRV